MYESKWFPYVGGTVDIELFVEVNEIIVSSKGVSKRSEKRIDNAILPYYTLSPTYSVCPKHVYIAGEKECALGHIKKILGQAIEVHLCREYVLTISCLATMWEGLIHKKVNVVGRYGSKKQRKISKDY